MAARGDSPGRPPNAPGRRPRGTVRRPSGEEDSMAALRHFDSFSEARSKLRCVLDSAREGLVTTVVRDNQRFVVVAADALAQDLRRLLPSQAVVVAEGGGWG